MTRDMTVGSPVRLLVLFTLPILLGSMLQQCYSLINAIIVGQRIGVSALAAIGAVVYLDGMIIGFVMAMLQGYAIGVSQRFGAKDESAFRRTVAMSVLMTMAVTVLLMACSLIAIDPLLRLMDTPQEIMAEARQYISIIFGCMLVPVLSNLAYAILRAMGDSRTPFICLIFSSVINIALDLLLVVWFSMGVVGVALGMIAAQLLVWPFLYTRLRRVKSLRLSRADWRPDRETCASLLRLGLPMALQNSIALVGVIVLQTVVNGFGVFHIAAFSAAMRIFFFVKEPSVAFSYAVSAFVGQNFGAGEMRRVREGVRKGLYIMLGICGAAMAVLFAFGRPILGLIISAEETETLAAAYPLLRTLAAFLPALYLMFTLRPALQGMGNTLLPMISGAVELVARSAASLLLPPIIGFAGVGFAEVSAWASAAILLCAAYFGMRPPALQPTQAP